MVSFVRNFFLWASSSQQMFLLFIELIELPCCCKEFNNDQVDGWNGFMNSIPDLAYYK